jgi:hypothetical protein
LTKSWPVFPLDNRAPLPGNATEVHSGTNVRMVARYCQEIPLSLQALEYMDEMTPIVRGKCEGYIEGHAVPSEVETFTQIGVPGPFPSGLPSNNVIDSS